jgi:iron complex transport system ATP-binding protein
MSLLQVSHLDIAVGDRLLISKLELQIDRGEFWCILGKNGSGKTTLLQVIAGLRSNSKAQIQLCGEALQSTPLALLAQRRGLMLQQQLDVFAHTVFDVVVSGQIVGCGSINEDSMSTNFSVSVALEKVGMAGSEGRNVLTLSGGERQRVALAALLAQAPELMLLDEPVSHQDVEQQLQVMRLLRELSISSCHDINLARRFATHALVLGEAQHWSGLVGDTLVPEILRQAFGCEFIQQGDWLVPFQAHATSAG